MKKKISLLLLFVLCVCGMRAQYVAPSEGVFRIINVEYSSALAENHVSNTIYSTQVGGNTSFDQLWILKQSGANYTLQNAYTCRYIQTGNNVNEQPYWTDVAAKAFNIVANSAKGDDAYNIWDPTLGSLGLHAKGMGERVVRWGRENDKAASEWKFVSVEVDEDALKQAQAEYAAYEAKVKAFEEEYAYLSSNVEEFETTLAKYFEDAACTVLKPAYSTLGDEALRSAMAADALPATLVDMAIKVKNGDWSEANEVSDKKGWDSDYAKKFRVQLIEPYSIAGEITSWFGHNAHTNMDNPTGLYTNNCQVAYIMVEGEIKEGAELWACWINGHSKMPNYNNGYSNGVRLKEGLNLVPFSTSDGNTLYINYLVHTYNPSTKTFTRKLGDYDDLKVHIEGGYINGYYNTHGDALYTADTDADWVYYEERANMRNITILGRHQVLQFELNDVTVTEENGNTWTERGLAKLFPEELPASLPENQRINAIVEAWDRIMLIEKMTMGLVSKEVADSMNLLYPRWDGAWENKAEMYDYEGYYDYCEGRNYADYYNHHGLAFGTVTGYMYGSWDHCGYHINTTPSVLTQIATEAGPTWGPAHEIGHQHQGLLTVNGLTEVTNNLFSNIAVWYMGMGTSRVNGSEGSLPKVYDNFKAGGDFFGNNIWALTQMYYRLWLYYHRAGNDTQFYPKLFELLRHNPMSGGYYQQGKTSILHFYQMCCEAAQEDLTEFFRAYGFFRVMSSRFVGDYSNSEYTQSQADIDAAIAAVKAKGYPVNNKPLFINDCTPEATYSHDGKTQRSYWDGGSTTNGSNAQVGSYVLFATPDTTITGKYVYALVDNKVTLSGGNGAAGFAIYNKEGEILAFANHYSFTINDDVLSLVRSGEASVVAIAPVGDDVVVKSKAEDGTEEEQLQALKTSLSAAKAILNLSDDKGVNVGYFKADYLTELQALVEAAEAARDNQDTSMCSYGEWAMALDQMVVQLTENAAAKVPVYEDDYYALGSVRHKNNSLEYSTAGLKVTFASPAENTKKQWVLVPTSVEHQYYVQNVETGLYVSIVSENVRVKAEAKESKEAVAFNLIEDEPSRFLLQSTKNTALYLSSESNKNVTAVNGSSANAQWTLYSVVDNHSEAMKAKLEALIGMVAVTLNELVAETEPALKFHDDITILDDNLSAYVATLQAAYDAARKALAEGYAYLEDCYAPLDAAHRAVKAAYKKPLTLPEATVGDEAMCYYLQCLDTEAYAYHFEGAGRYNGALRTSELTDASDHNYWFYLRPGEAEGQYYIYNLYTGEAVGTSGRYIYANGTVEATAYTMTVSTDAYGYTLSDEDGMWNVQSGDNGYVQYTTKAAQWMLIPIGRFDVTGIEPVEHATATGVYYDLMGRPVQHPTPGIYILDGRKVILK